ncbi:MAG: hypothetical protein Q7R47_01060 [Candidatus Diapherotrites archaeon]|nr:hypothetical protein [Candidatus Diapherotrites archaeon]
MDALVELVQTGLLPVEPPTPPDETVSAETVASPTTTDDAPMLCSECGQEVEQNHFETSFPEGATDPKYKCSACLSPKPETGTPATPIPETAPVADLPAEKLIATVQEATRVRESAYRFDLKDIVTAITEEIEAIVANLEANEIGDWRAYGNLRKTLENVITESRGIIEEHARKERNDRFLVAHRIRNIAGMKLKNLDLVTLQQARGKGDDDNSAPATSSIIGRMPIDIKNIPADIPCVTPGCKGMVPGFIVAKWTNGKTPHGGFRCHPCHIKSKDLS